MANEMTLEDKVGEALLRKVDISKTDIPCAIVPRVGQLVGLEGFLEKPMLKRAVVELWDRESFVAYIKNHKLPTSRIFANFVAETPKAECVMDYHGNGEAFWGLHRADLVMKNSKDWLLWMSHNKKRFGQRDFAEFIEENLHAFSQPSAAEMLEVVRDFKACTKAVFSSEVSEDNGDVVFHFEQKTSPEKTKRGKLEVPERFAIKIPVFEGEPAVEIEAWLRYDITEGVLTFRYVLKQPEKAREEEATRILAEIKKATDIPILTGTLISMPSPKDEL